MHTLSKACRAKYAILYMLYSCWCPMASCIKFNYSGNRWHLSHCLVTGFCQFYDCSGERSNRAQKTGHRAAIVGGFSSRYRSSFFGDGELVRIPMVVYLCMFRVTPIFGETGTLVPTRYQASQRQIPQNSASVLGCWAMDFVQIPMSLCSACASQFICCWNIFVKCVIVFFASARETTTTSLPAIVNFVIISPVHSPLSVYQEISV